jgi:hypothetical protein
MAFKLASAFVELYWKRDRFDKGLSKTKKDVDDVGHRFGRLTQMSGKQAAAATAIFTVTGLAMARLFKGIAAGERSMGAVKSALRATGQEVDNNAGKIDDLTNAMREQLNIDDDLTKSAAAYAIRLGRTADEAANMTKVAAGLSQALGVSVMEAMKTVIGAQNGQYRTIGRLIPGFKNLRTQEEKLAAIQKLAAAGILDRKAQMNELGGIMKQVGFSAEEMGESWIKAFFNIEVAGRSMGETLVEAFRSMTVGTDDYFINVNNRAAQLLELQKKTWQLDLFFGVGTARAKQKIADIDEAINNIEKENASVIEDKNKKNNLALDALKAHNNELAKQVKLIKGMENYWRLVQEAMLEAQGFDVRGKGLNNAKVLGGGGAAAGRGGVPAVIPPQGGAAGAGGAAGGAAPAGAAGSGAAGTAQPSAGGGDKPSSGKPSAVAPHTSTRAKRQEYWNKHKRNFSRNQPRGGNYSLQPTSPFLGDMAQEQVGKPGFPPTNFGSGMSGGTTSHEVRDREWHRKNADRLRERVNWMRQEMGMGNMKGKFYQDSLARKQAELQRSSDIAEFGSTARAGYERANERDRRATQDRINRHRLQHLKMAMDRGGGDDEMSWAQHKIDEDIAREKEALEKRKQQRLNAPNSGGRNKTLKQKIAEEEAALKDNRDVGAEEFRGYLQNRFGISQSGGPIKVEDEKMAALVTAVADLTGAIKKMDGGSTFGEGDDF